MLLQKKIDKLFLKNQVQMKCNEVQITSEAAIMTVNDEVVVHESITIDE